MNLTARFSSTMPSEAAKNARMCEMKCCSSSAGIAWRSESSRRGVQGPTKPLNNRLDATVLVHWVPLRTVLSQQGPHESSCKDVHCPPDLRFS